MLSTALYFVRRLNRCRFFYRVSIASNTIYLNMFDAKPGCSLSKDVLWLKYLFFTSFRLSVYSLQRADYIESDARFTIT